MTPGTPVQLSLAVIRLVFVQSWVNGSGCAVLFAATGTVGNNAQQEHGDERWDRVTVWADHPDHLGQDALVSRT